MALFACGSGHPSPPDMPRSVAPGWTLASFSPAEKPSDITSDPPVACWKGAYTGPGPVDFWICAYRASGSAFDAAQRSRAEAQTVKFQVGSDLVLVKWGDVPKTDLQALIRQIQKTLH
jgi:hypothetical protein